MSLMFDDDDLELRAPKRGRRLTAVAAVTLLALSWSLLGSLASETARPMQSVAWVFGPAPGAEPID